MSTTGSTLAERVDEVAPVEEAQQFSRAQAQRITERIRAAGEALYSLMLTAYEHRAHTALGYETWEGYVREEFRMSRGESYRLIDQGRVIKELTAEVGVTRAREAAPFVSGRQAAVLKHDMPSVAREVADAMKQGVEVEEAVKAAVAKRTQHAIPMEALPPARPAAVRRGAVIDEEELLEQVGEFRERLRSCFASARANLSRAPRREAGDLETLRDELRQWLIAISLIVNQESLESMYMLRAEIYDWLKSLGDERSMIAQLAGVTPAAVDYSVTQLRQVSEQGKRKRRS